MIPSALPGGSPATVAALRDVLGIELLQAALSTPYASQALGEAGTTAGDYFAVDAGGGTVSIYLRTGGGSTLKGTINVSGVAGGGGGGGGGGTVTSVALSVGTGISLTGASPITGAGSWLLTLSAFLQSWSAIDPAAKSDVGHTHTFTSLASKPTTLAGYGITDAAALAHSHTFASLTGKPTTVAGYGIVDAASLSSFSAPNGSSLVGFQQAGTGAQARVLQDKARERLSIADFVTPAGLAQAVARSSEVEISTALTNAIAQATALGGAEIYIPAGSWKASTTIVVDEPSIDIIGAGGDGNHDAASPATGTVIRWRGADGGELLRVQSKGLVGSPTPSGGSVRNLQLVGGATNTMAVALRVASVRGWTFENITIINPTTQGVYVTVQASGAEARDTQKCLFRHITVRCLAAVSISGTGFELAGDTGANASFNIFEHCDVLFQNGTGYKLVTADNNMFVQCRGFRPSGTGYTLEVHGNNTPILACSANTFYGFSPSSAGIKLFGTTTYTTPSAMTVFYAFDMANGSALPVVEPGATWHMHKSSGTTYQDYLVRPVFGVDDSAVDAHRAARSTETQRIYNFSANHARYVDGTGNEWCVRLDGSGNFEVLRISGSGVFKVYNAAEFSGTLAVNSGNRVLLQGAGNLTGIRYQSSNIEMYVGANFAAGFGTNTVGFNGTTPVAKPAVTGSKGGNAALASLLAALASMGLITNSSS